MSNNTMTINEYIRKKTLAQTGLINSDINPNSRADRLTFVNNINEIIIERLREYNVWYGGDSDEIMNYYTKNGMIDYNTDPLYNRNKKSYFWCVSSTEGDIKRTHSGQARNIVDTLVNIVGLPKITADQEEISTVLNQVLDDNNFDKLLNQKQLPLTLIEGWGAWKINYNTNLRDTPILIYYRADSVDFIESSGQLIGIVYKDYYTDEKGNNYILFETRRHEKKNGKINLVIEKELFRLSNGTDTIVPYKLSDLKQLQDTEPVLIIENYSGFFGGKCVIFEDNNGDTPGRSIFTGKIDLFDDLDQCLSQAANTVRRSTAQEYFNSNYLEKDQHSGLPIMPHAFDRKYVMFNGGVDANGATAGQDPVHVTQPALNFQQYDAEATSVLLQIISGLMSPATLGIDIAKKDNAEAQREKEKVTIFTRNTIIAEMTKCYKNICSELLCANELMNQHKITVKKYNISVKFDEFADASFENKIETLMGAYNSGVMTPELFIEMLYKDQLSEDKKNKEIEFLKEQVEQAQQAAQGGQQGGMPEDELGELGAVLGGNNNNPENFSRAGLDAIAQDPTLQK